MIAHAEQLIGMGLYTPGEAARYAKVTPQLLNRWVFGSKAGEPVVNAQIEYPDLKGRTVSFLDLMQVLTIRNLRMQPSRDRRPALQRIREAVDIARRDHRIEFPLARRHRLAVFDGSVFIQIGGDWIGVSRGRDRGQILEPNIVEPFIEDFTFGPDELPERWTPLSDGKLRVSFDPRRRFGQPTLEPYGILVEALANQFYVEESYERAADAFEVEPDAVRFAVKYRDFVLGGPASL